MRNRDKPSGRAPLLGLVVGALGLLIVFGVVGLPGLKTFSWEKTTGTIDSYSKLRSASNKDVRNPVRIRYHYEVDGKTFTSERYKFGRALIAPGAQRYRSGTELSVYYNPSDPAQSVVERGVGGRTASFAIPFILLLFFSAFPEQSRAALQALRRR